MKRVLVIEDDPDIAFSVKYNLERSGPFAVTTAADGEVGLEEARRTLPALLILDLNLPGMDGLEVCRLLRGEDATAAIPIIMVTARTDEADRIRGLDEGADDYLVKPFSIRELVARVHAVLRRVQPQGDDERVLRGEDIVVHTQSRRVTSAGRDVTLTRKEFDLLACLMTRRGRVLTRDRLLEDVWGYEYPGETRTVDVHVRRLRQKLGEPGKDAIETVVGVGYRFRGPA